MLCAFGCQGLRLLVKPALQCGGAGTVSTRRCYQCSLRCVRHAQPGLPVCACAAARNLSFLLG
ncbi:hypothetical protein BRN01_02505, partial [Xanthomonas oryzae pv. oryzae]